MTALGNKPGDGDREVLKTGQKTGTRLEPGLPDFENRPRNVWMVADRFHNKRKRLGDLETKRLGPTSLLVFGSRASCTFQGFDFFRRWNEARLHKGKGRNWFLRKTTVAPLQWARRHIWPCPALTPRTPTKAYKPCNRSRNNMNRTKTVSFKADFCRAPNVAGILTYPNRPSRPWSDQARNISSSPGYYPVGVSAGWLLREIEEWAESRPAADLPHHRPPKNAPPNTRTAAHIGQRRHHDTPAASSASSSTRQPRASKASGPCTDSRGSPPPRARCRRRAGRR